MSTVRLTRDLLTEGYTHDELARKARAGELTRVRRGAYDGAGHQELEPRHLRMVEATVQLTAGSAVVSHMSGAIVHGLPVVATSLTRVQMTRADVAGGRDRGGVHLYSAPLPSAEVVEVSGVRVTSVARTVVDIGRTESFARAVVTGDAALRQGLDPVELAACLRRSSGRPGIARARRAIAFLDGRSESPGESLSRVTLHTAGIAPPTLQYEVTDESGRLVGRADFGWEDHLTLGEFDGRVKYGRLVKPGQTAADAVYAEKLREDALRDLGWQVVRWTYSDLRKPEIVTDRLHRAFARSAR